MPSRAADQDAAPPPKVEKASLLDDFMDIFYAPAAVFARRQTKSFWVPLLIVSVLFGLVALANRDLMEPIMDAEMTRAMAAQADGPQLTPEQMEASREMMHKFAPIGAFLGTPFFMLGLGIVVWLVGKFFDSQASLNAALVVTSFAWVPRVVEGILTRVQGTLMDTGEADSRFAYTLGPGRFLDADTTSPLLLAVIGRLDVITIWVTVLIAIGLAVTGKISRGKAALAAVVIWIIGALPSIAGALR
jgi:hypothetical protein